MHVTNPRGIDVFPAFHNTIFPCSHIEGTLGLLWHRLIPLFELLEYHRFYCVTDLYRRVLTLI
jgi:hypothetical protein